MKTLLTTTAALTGLAVSMLGQGAVYLDNTLSIGSVYSSSQAKYYAGSFGIQLWELNGTTVPGNINSLSGVNCSQAYANLTADGFTLETTTGGTTLPGLPGSFSLIAEPVDMPNVSPRGGSCVLAVAFWEGTSATFLGAQYAGVLAFVNPTSDYTANGAPPTPPTLTGWDTAPGGVADQYPGGVDLVTSLVPEPGTVALTNLGAAALLVLRRRKVSALPAWRNRTKLTKVEA